MQQYTFLVRKTKRKERVHIEADRLTHAIGKAFMKHPNKFVTIKYAKNMDLISAKEAAKKESAAQKKPFYVIVDEKSGEADISSAPLRGALHKFANGVEVKDFAPKAEASEKEPSKKTLPAQSEKAQKLISKQKVQNMKKESKSAPKKGAKKIIAKKSSTPKEEKLIRGNNMALSKAEWAKVDAILKKEETTFSAWSRGLVLAKIK